MTAARKLAAPPPRWLGWLLLLNAALVVAAKLALNRPGDLLWFSHVGLFAAGLGLALRSDTLLAATYVGVTGLHAVWLYDAICGLCTGSFPLGITRYLLDADGWTWAGTLHHFYLAPLLVTVMFRRPICPPRALLIAVTAFLYLTLLSRLLLPPADNVNFAYGTTVTGHYRIVEWGNRQVPGVYLPGLCAFVTLVYFTPAFLLAQIFAWRARRTRSDLPAAGVACATIH